MDYLAAKEKCHCRSAIYRRSVGFRYYKNHPVPLDERISEADKREDDWEEHDPRDDDDCSLFMFND